MVSQPVEKHGKTITNKYRQHGLSLTLEPTWRSEGNLELLVLSPLCENLVTELRSSGLVVSEHLYLLDQLSRQL